LLSGILGGQPQQQSPYDWMQPEAQQGGGGLFGGLSGRKGQITGYLAGALMPGTTQERIARGLGGMTMGGQNDIMQQQRMDAIRNQREQRGSAAGAIDAYVKAGKISPADARFFANNPKAWEEYSKGLINPNTQIAPSGDIIQTGPFGRISTPGGVPISDPREVTNPDGSKSPAYGIRPSLSRPQGGIAIPGQPQMPQEQPGQPAFNPNLPNGGRPIITEASPQATEERKGVGADLAKELQTINTKAAGATTRLSTLNRLSQLSPQAYEGAGAPALQLVRSFLTTLGLPSGSVPAGEEFVALSNKMVLDANNGSLGTGVSNSDVAFIKNMQPDISQTREGRMQLIDTAKALAKRDQEVARQAAQYRKANG
jgi:hypothetical protein